MHELFRSFPYFLIATPLFASDSDVIQKMIEQTDADFFASRSMRLDVLKNHEDAIPALVEWIYEEWRSYDATLTRERLIRGFRSRLNSDRIPITFVALKQGAPIGVISLKEQLDPELSDFPKESIWMGSLQILAEERGQGLATELLKFAVAVTGRLGHEKLYLYISNPAYVQWYVERGAEIIEERLFRNHMATILCIPS